MSNPDKFWKQAYAEICRIPLSQIKGDLFAACQKRADELRYEAGLLPVGPFTLADPNKPSGPTIAQYRPVWVEDSSGNRLFTVSIKGDPVLGRFVVKAMNVAANVSKENANA